MRKTLAAIAAGALLLFTVAACGSGTKPAPEHRAKKEQHSEVYHDSTSGHTYAQTYDDSGVLVWYVLWMNQTNTPYVSSSPVTSLPSSSSWSRATGTSSGGSGTSSYAPNTSTLTSTSRVVAVNEDGEPEVEEGELTPDSEVPADEVTDANTSAEEAQADADFNNQVEADNIDIDNGVDPGGNSGEVGGDSGDTGGSGGNIGVDSGGGGDFSGGDSGGSFDSGGGGDFGG